MRLVRKDKQKLITYLMLIILTTTLLPMEQVTAAGMSLTTCKEKYAYTSPPPGYSTCIQFTDPDDPLKKRILVKGFNQKLWDDQQVVVYGTEYDLNLRASDFKTTWQTLDRKPRKNTDTTIAPPHPYYRNSNGTRGEYRYYGYDLGGSKYSNPYFWDDANSGLEADQKKWVYRPWESNLTLGNRQRPASFSPDFGKQYQNPDNIYRAGPRVINQFDSWVHNDNFEGGIIEATGGKPKDSILSKTTRHLFDYMYVEQAPSVWADGQGRMFHQQSDGDIWYQSFPLTKLEGKKNPGLKSTTIKSREPMEMDLSKLPNTWQWTFDFQSIINDDRKVDPADEDVMYKDPFRKLEYYTRNDVAYWKFTITYTISGQDPRTDTVTTDQSGKVTYDKGRQIGNYFETLSFKNSDFKAGDSVNVQLKAEAHYGTTNVERVFDAGTTTLNKTFTKDKSR
ncbi:hypothetical protein E5161_17495 [Cohnella pontilimi]|uniref:Uncharacterized protein n=1 Tax=Cohnella pontilimi TaxID=2564100 RepID=A0A4U0F581_9BACL|nr:hypothetical protein [Cohnella pontilimi]TJY39743.1 hypothetical protein E5161_17495 [Cohnella pontilimi]